MSIKNINKILPGNWIWTTVGDIGIVASGGTPSTINPENWGGKIPWVTPADLSGYNKSYISKGKRNLTQMGLDYSSAKLLPKGSILFSSRAPIGYVVIAKNEIATNQGFKNLIVTQSLCSQYVYYYFKTIKSLTEKMASGTTFLELSATNFSRIPFPLPPLNEQNRIVAKIEELFSEIDKAKEGLEKAQKQLEIYKHAYLNSAFEKKTNWKSYKVGEIFTLIDGDRGKNYPKRNDYLNKGYCLFLSTKNVRSNIFVFNEKVFISKKKHNDLRNGTLVREDIILTTRGTLGNVALYDESVPYSVMRINSGMIIMRVKSRKYNRKYLSNYLISPHFQNQINKRKTGTAQPQLPSNILKNLIINFPSEYKQSKIIRNIETQFSIIENIENSINIGLKKIQTFQNAVLKKAFEGKLVPQDINVKSANELLKQIQIEKDTFLVEQKLFQKLKPKKREIMEKDKTILELLKEANDPILTEAIWQNSKHFNDIDAFYAELKTIIRKVEVSFHGKQSKLGLKK